MTYPSLKTVLILSVLVWLLGLPIASSYAQNDDTMRGQISEVRVVRVLPAGIRFWVRIEAPHEDVARVDLTLIQDETSVVETSLDLDESIIFIYREEGAIQYEYFLDLHVETDIQLFEDLIYRVDAETRDGVQSSMEGIVRVEHQEVGRWQEASLGDQFTLHWLDPTLNGEQLVGELLDVFNLMRPYVDEITPLEVVLYAPFQSFCTIVENEEGEEESVVESFGRLYPCSIEFAEALYTLRDMRMLVYEQINYQFIFDQLSREIVKGNFSAQWDEVEVPAWYEEGLALYLLPAGQPESLRAAQRASQTGRLLRLSQLTRLPNGSSVDEELWYAQAYLLNLYIADQYGADAPQRIARLINEETSFEQAFQEVTGTDIATTYAEWVIWLDSARAVEVSEWNPYLPDTPTPTLTLTPSSVPPTRTFAPSSTPSATYTLRPLFVPTDLPTRTFAPPTVRASPTPTALPVGFFDRISPTPAPPNVVSNSESGDDSLCNAGIGALFLPIFGLAAAFWQRKGQH